MATLEKIRSKAGLLVGVVGVALFAFIIGDGLRSGSTFFQQTKEAVLTVDGQTVKIDEYMRRVTEMTDIYAMNGGSNLTDAQQSQLRNDVFETLVREILIEREAEKVGFSFTSQEMFDMVQGENISPMIQQMPMFQNQAGQFDKAALMRFLQIIETNDLSTYSDQDRAQIESSKKYWLFIESTLKQQRLEEKYGTLLAKAIVVNPIDAKAEFEDNQGSVDFDYVLKNYASVADSTVNVTTAEIEKLYQKRKKQFKQDPAVELKYIALTVAPSEEDFADVEKSMEKLKEEFVSSEDVSDLVNEVSDTQFSNSYASTSLLSPDATKFVEGAQVGEVQGPILVGNSYHMYKYLGKMIAPDSIRVNELTMPMFAEAELKHLTDSLVNLLKGGKTFADLAMELTGGRSNGDLGWLTDQAALTRLGEEFRNSIFDAKVNDIYVLKTITGTHLVQVTEKTKPVDKYKVADIAMSVEPSNKTTSEAFTRLNQYVLKNKTLESFESEAPAAGFVCQRSTVGQNEPLLAGIPSTRPIIRWAFENEKGEISDVTECDGYRYVVAMVENNLKKGYRPLASVADVLKRELIDDKKAEKIIADIQSKNCNSLEQCGEMLNLPVQSVKFVNFGTRRISGLGLEPALNVAAPVAELNQLSKPIKGKAGIYVLKVTEKHPATGEFNLEQQTQTLETQNAYRYMYQAMQSLRDKADVEDYRIRFY